MPALAERLPWGGGLRIQSLLKIHWAKVRGTSPSSSDVINDLESKLDANAACSDSSIHPTKACGKSRLVVDTPRELAYPKKLTRNLLKEKNFGACRDLPTGDHS
jgi:hypothetical protein